MTLKNKLMEIHGIGESKASEIIAVLEEYETTVEHEELNRVIDQARRGNEQAVIGFLESLR